MKDNQNNRILESIKTSANINSGLKIKDLLNEKRLSEFHVKTDYLSYDYSKQRITKEVLGELLEIPEKINLKKAIVDISKGEFLNPTENRNVSHMLYRDLSNSKNSHDLKEISDQRNKLSNFLETIQGAPESYIDTIISNIQEAINYLINSKRDISSTYFITGYRLSIKKIVFMGGAAMTLGNITPVAEFNISITIISLPDLSTITSPGKTTREFSYAIATILHPLL